MTLIDEHAGPEPLSKESFEELARFRFGIRRYLRFSEEVVRRRGVTPQQYQVLLALKGFPGREWASIGELADWLRLRHHSMVELVDRAQEQGLLRRLQDPDDARVVRVELTADGDQLLAELSALHHDELRRMGSAFDLPSTAETADLAERIVGATQEAVVYADRDGVIQLWNAGAETLFGYSADEALGRSLDLIIPEKHRKPHWDGWNRVMETGETSYGREPLAVPGVRADGSRVSLEFSITLLRDSDGRISGIAAVLRDVTARWQKDKETRRKVASLEAELAQARHGTPEDADQS